MATDVQTGTITTQVPARLDRLPWSRFHRRVVIGWAALCFFLAGSGASAAYLTVSEIFPNAFRMLAAGSSTLVRRRWPHHARRICTHAAAAT
ncbi:hypothetical protein [Mycobacterium xenopi]|uniref:Uncharacterized protein n=1 Tax=Mycobacterium xenopi TaxID=1789 RepID=A0AAD1H2H6_MYCXE|nr:hypothetical protein [Mycobacterium xenopi]ORX22014.1 hypothetical protein AWC32_00740 [Mycobacterium xenopi]BBU23968.1 hypothetical protein MYXE_37580 [Mycobacterium xenopi]SPX90791.1 Major facilitator superfamily MFS_1 [Mycobacterium xenopi]